MSQYPEELPPPPPPSPYYASTPGRKKKKVDYDEFDYEDIYYHFDDYSQDVILANASKFMTPPEPAEHYEWEEVILDEVAQSEWEGMKRSMYLGVGCGLASFAMLRYRRIRNAGGGMGRYASSSSHSGSGVGGAGGQSTRSSGGYTFDPVPPRPSQGAIQQHHHHHNQHHYAGGGGGNASSPLGLFFDVTLAGLISAGTSLAAIESDIFYPTTTTGTNSGGNDRALGENAAIDPPPQWISPNIPLVPGRSIIADTLCGPLTEEFRKFPKELWRSGNDRGFENGYDDHMALYANSGWKGTKYYRGNDNASVVSLGENGDVDGAGDGASDRGVYERLLLDSLQGFVINCERRARHERKMRKIRGLREGTPVVIPDGGVTADEDLELDDIYFVEKEGEDGGGDDSFGL